MAFVVLSSLAQTLNQILNHDQYPISAYGKQQIASLHQQVLSLLDFLKKSDEKGNSLETRMRDAANEAEDIIEHFMYEHIRYQKSMAATSILYDLRELKIVMEEMDSIAQEAMERSGGPTVESLPSSSATAAPTHVYSFTVGLDEDLKKIINSLCKGSPSNEIIAITGMGGIGKTTLARNAYNHDLVKEHFQIRTWVTLSHDFKMENILSHLEDCLKYGATNDDSEMDKTRRIFELLWDKRHLIVLDDLWSTATCCAINILLPENLNGSRIMITTRQKHVAYDMYSRYHHEMRFLDENQSWILLKQKAFPNKECPPEMEKIGKDIAKRCGGLPLAILLTADVLSTTPPHSWKKVAENVSAAIAEPFDKVMSSSYIHLPHHLRPCFLYMGGFPEDYEIRVSKLIKLWIGEGFIEPRPRKSLEEVAKDYEIGVSKLIKLWIGEGFVEPRPRKSLEEVAKEYLGELLWRSLAFVTKSKSNGRMKSCNVHDMIRGMCRRIAKDENSERRLSIAHRDLRCVAKVYGSTLRSVTCFQPSHTSLKSLRKLPLLRVLDVVDTTGTYFLPHQVFDLFHLRYLSFGCPMEIPAAISRLQNLRILIIRPSERSRRYLNNDEVYLPLEIWRLPLLTVLISFFDLLPNPDGAAYVLDELLTLSVVKKLICTKELMKKIPNLKKLGITFFEDKYKQDCQLQNLKLLHHLEELKLVMRADSPVRLEIKPVFPKMLKKLTLSGWRCPWGYLYIVGALPYLEVLKLRDHACRGHKWKTIHGQFRSLKYLLIDTSDLKVWEVTYFLFRFPKLEHLALYRCSLLRKIPHGIGDVRTLKLIEVDRANEDLVERVKRIQEKSKRRGKPDLQVCIGASPS